MWDRTELETRDGLDCNLGRDDCRLGVKGSMDLVPVSDADRELLNRVLRDVVVKRWAQRCGMECAAEWNRTIGAAVDIRAEP
jgi:hypothetical protein